MSDDRLAIHSEAAYVGTATARPSPPPDLAGSYLAKDYAGFRQLILDRLAERIPGWQERHIPDVGIMLVELMAYLGDQLSYYQDAVATEAYLGTARRRISLRRHARLVDYPMHEGCNARAWVCLRVREDCTLDLDQVAFATRPPGAGAWVAEEELTAAPRGGYELFEPIVAERGERFTAADLRPGLRYGPLIRVENDDGAPTLLALRALLPPAERDALTDLVQGGRALNEDQRDVVIDRLNLLLNTPLAARPAPRDSGRAGVGLSPEPFLRGPALRRHRRGQTERDLAQALVPRRQARLYHAQNEIVLDSLTATTAEIASAVARTLAPGDFLLFQNRRDPLSCQVVRLTAVGRAGDDGAQPARVAWASEDALPKKLVANPAHVVARGNVLLVDHGHTRHALPLERAALLPGLAPTWRLAEGPLVFRQRLAEPAPGEERPSAAALLRQDPGQATPDLYLSSRADPWRNLDNVSLGADGPGPERWRHVWVPRRDLLASGPRDLHVVIENDDDGVAWLRFGDGEAGMRPDQDADLRATFRVGGGSAGNVGAGAIDTLVYRRWSRDLFLVEAVSNPLPATGGRPPEPIDTVRLFAPDYFRTRLERAVTADDYAAIVMRDFAAEVQKAAATLRWTGARYEVLVVVDPLAGDRPQVALRDPEDLCRRIRVHLEDYRRMGHALAVEPAAQVPVALTLAVRAQRDAWAGQVKADLEARFGRDGYFHPDRRSFGEGIALSEIYALAQAAPGVASAIVTELRRERGDPGDALVSGLLRFGPLEVASGGALYVRIEGGR